MSKSATKRIVSLDILKGLVMILMTQMKGWDYSRKEIFEKHVYNAVLDR